MPLELLGGCPTLWDPFYRTFQQPAFAESEGSLALLLGAALTLWDRPRGGCSLPRKVHPMAEVVLSAWTLHSAARIKALALAGHS